MTVSYNEPYKRADDLDPKVNGPFRDEEMVALEDASRKGKALDFFVEGMKAEQKRREADQKADALAGSAEETKKAHDAAHKLATKESRTPAKKAATKKTATKKTAAKKTAAKKTTTKKAAGKK